LDFPYIRCTHKITALSPKNDVSFRSLTSEISYEKYLQFQDGFGSLSLLQEITILSRRITGKLVGRIMRRISFALVIVGLCINTAAALDGSGTHQDPWRIKSLADFNEFAADANYWDDYTRLETDVNLAGRIYTTAVIAPDMTNSLSGFQGFEFTGVFDGNDKRITNLTINDGGADNDFLGLFGNIRLGEVRNLGLESGFVSGRAFIGGLMGANGDIPGDGGAITNCYSNVSVSGDDFIGGLAGLNSNSFSNCYYSGDVSGTGQGVGGLVGDNDGSFSNCYSTGDVSGYHAVGGVAGYNSSYGSISNCFSTCFVNGIVNTGGLVGTNSGSVSKCYSNNSISGYDYTGGLAGKNVGGKISNCYSMGSVSGDWFVGGLVAYNARGYYSGNVYNCYSIGDVNGFEFVGGLAAYNSSFISNCLWDTDTQTHGVTESIVVNEGTVSNVEGLSTTQMQTRSTFTEAGWDFVDTWLINDGATYPVLRQEIRSDLNVDGGVNFVDYAIFADHWLEGKGY
jgi:hypothetical protein